jgi:MFS family permease
MAVGTSIAMESDLTPRNLRTAAICLIGQSLGTSMLPLSALALVMLPMTGEFHWSRTQFSYAVSAVMWFGSLTGPFLGWAVDRWGVRPMVLGGTTAVGLATFALCRISHLWQFCLCFCLMGALGCSIGFVKVIGATFTKSRGKAFALMAAFFAMISSLLPQLVNVLLTRMGWRGVFSTLGVLVLAVVVLLFFTLEEPGEMKRPRADAAGASLLEGRTAAQAWKDRVFWVLVGAGVLTSLGAGWPQHQVAFLIGRGFTRQQVVNALSLTMFFSPLITMLSGWLADRARSAKIYAAFVLLTAVGILGQFLVAANRGGTPLLWAAMYLGLILVNAQLPLTQYFYSRYFGMKAFGEIFSFHMSIWGLVIGFAPPLIGLLFERTGSYDRALLLIIAGNIAAALLLLTLGPYRYSASPQAPIPKAGREKVAIA